MANIINTSILAVLYYNLKKENSYDLENGKDRKKAQSNFENTKKIDPELLAQAYESYKQMMEKEFENFL